VCLLDDAGRTLLLYNPDNWRPADLDSLRNRPLPDASAWIPLGLAEDGDPLAAYALRLAPDRVLQVGMDADLRADVLDSMQSVFLTTAVPVILLALLGGTLLAYRALRPARQFVRTFQDIIATGDVHTRAPANDMRGEFAEMVHLFNRMLTHFAGAPHRAAGWRLRTDRAARLPRPLIVRPGRLPRAARSLGRRGRRRIHRLRGGSRLCG